MPNPKTQKIQNPETATAHDAPEKMGVFENARGELIDARLRLVTDPERGEVWLGYMERTLPRDVLTRFGLINTPGSEEFANVVEHSANVAVAAVTLARQLQQAGVEVDVHAVERAAWVHDAAKRRDVLTTMKREDESDDDLLGTILAEYGYTPAEIEAAKNTGRLPDRYIQDPDERKKAIAAHSIEANIVGYVDARARGSEFMSVREAGTANALVKFRDKAFFSGAWKPYYLAVEEYFSELAPGFDPKLLTEDTIFATIAPEASGDKNYPYSSETIDFEMVSGGEHMAVSIETFTEGKGGPEADPAKNEDVVITGERGVVLADGSTTKNKQLAAQFESAFGGRSGGRTAAEIVAKTAYASSLEGRELVDEITAALRDLYAEKFPQAFDSDGHLKKEMLMAATFVAARFDTATGQLVVTRVGDTSYRITFKDGRRELYQDERKIDKVDAANRAKAIRQALAAGVTEKDAVVQGREAILGSLNKQAGEYWNNPDSEYGFGYVTGGYIPDDFIKVERYSLAEIDTVEVVSDGYTYAPPEELPTEPTVAAWEDHIAAVHDADPSKYLRYLSTKPSDDRLIAIVRL